MDKNTTEYSICTRDLGYNIKGIEPEKTTSSETSEPSETTETTATSPKPNDSQVKEAQRVGCVSLRAVKLDDLIASNKQNGISEEDTRITYQSGTAQCDALGF